MFQTVWDISHRVYGELALADNGLMLVEGDDSGTSTTVDITYRGTRRHIVQLDRSKVRVTADLSGITSAGVPDGEYHTLLYGPWVQPVQYRH